MILKMTWEEIKAEHPDQWVSLTKVERDENGMIRAGAVTAAGPDLKSVTRKLKREKRSSDAFEFTGSIKNFLGFARWEMTNVNVKADR